MHRKLLSIIICCFISCLASAQIAYRVTSSSRLNIRQTPSTTGNIIGTFKSGEDILVISINNGWAKVRYNNGIGYVNQMYIKKLSTDSPIKNHLRTPRIDSDIILVEDEHPRPKEDYLKNKHNNNKATKNTVLTLGKIKSNKLDVYITFQAGIGCSNFIWNDGSVNPTMSYSADIMSQVYFNEKVSFIPSNWYGDISIGFDKKGASNFDMNYIHMQISPIGYHFLLSNFVTLTAKTGIAFGMPLADLETHENYWPSDFQCGVLGGVSFEYKQFSVGCNIEYDITEVSKSCNQKLNNIAILGTLSYKFAQFGHKK